MLNALTASDPDHRRVALGAAQRLGVLAVEHLVTALKDPDVAVRRRALELAARHRSAPTAGRGLSESASTTAGQTGETAPGNMTQLARAMTGLLDDEAVAEVAAFALGELAGEDGLASFGPAGAEIGAKLEAQAQAHTDPLCRESAVAALGSLSEGLDVVLSATNDIAAVRRRAIVALAAFDGPEVEAALVRALGDRDWQVRQVAEDLLDSAEGLDPE